MSKRVVISIIYVYFNTYDDIKVSLASIKKAIGESYKFEIIVVDNKSEIKISERIVKKYKIKLITNASNVGYGNGLNVGSKIAKGKLLLFTNPDVIFKNDSIKTLADRILSDRKIAVVGPKYVNRANKLIKIGTEIPKLPDAIIYFTFLDTFLRNKLFAKYALTYIDRNKENFLPAICGACMLVRKNVFERINGFDSNFFMYFEEVDLCDRISRNGFRVLYYPRAIVVHYGGRSNTNKRIIRKYYEKSRLYFFKKKYGLLVAYFSEGLIRSLNYIPDLLSFFKNKKYI